MISRIRQVAAVALVALAAISFTHQSASAQTLQTITLPTAVQNQITTAMTAGNTAQVLSSLRTVMNANPQLAGQIATVAGQLNSALVASIGAQAAQAVANSNLSDEQKAAQMQQTLRGLAAVNPAAAGDIAATMGAAVPGLANTLVAVLADIQTAAGPLPPVIILPPGDPFPGPDPDPAS